ncbi:hypothetical protein KC960_03725 [Candidatus Saccharibacteria bacterium]|nr:hypothetical protein [Candidatus Saccharibacteria bacterium]
MNYSICVSGAAAGESVDSACGLAYEVGVAIARGGHITTTGATVGVPMYAAKGSFDAGGMSVGFSPASSMREHTKKYRLPIGFFSYINFTGMQYIGRDIHLVQSSDAVITIGGRMGSMHEFSTAIEADKPCGVLIGSGGLADYLPKLLDELEEIGQQAKGLVYFDTDPERLVKTLIKVLDEKNKDLKTKNIAEEWAIKASICEPLAGKFGFIKGTNNNLRQG